MLGMTFEQAVRSFGWGEVANFADHLPEDSATFRAQHKDAYLFSTHLQQSAMLADVIDSISAFAYMFGKAHGSKGRKPEPYPRPWMDGETQRIGSKPIPISEFNDWYYGGD